MIRKRIAYLEKRSLEIREIRDFGDIMGTRSQEADLREPISGSHS
jgi:hypothetical protein